MTPFLGQVPLVLGPGSWGFPGLLPDTAPQTQFFCPPGTFMTADASCRPLTTQEGGVTGQPEIRSLPVFAFPLISGGF
jgi:hypothetical protein